jgi:hypothetical protein
MSGNDGGHACCSNVVSFRAGAADHPQFNVCLRAAAPFRKLWLNLHRKRV